MPRALTGLLAMALLVFAVPSAAKDFGPTRDVRQIKSVVTAKFGQAANVSVSHGWALCISNDQESDLSVLLRRVGGKWKIVRHDGGAFGAGDLRASGVPAADVPRLLKTYQ